MKTHTLFFFFFPNQSNIFYVEKGTKQTAGWRLHLEGWHDVTCQYNGVIISWGGTRTKKTPSVYGLWKGLSSSVSAALWSFEEMAHTKSGRNRGRLLWWSTAVSISVKPDGWVLINSPEIQVRIKTKFVRFVACCFRNSQNWYTEYLIFSLSLEGWQCYKWNQLAAVNTVCSLEFCSKTSSQPQKTHFSKFSYYT